MVCFNRGIKPSFEWGAMLCETAAAAVIYGALKAQCRTQQTPGALDMSRTTSVSDARDRSQLRKAFA